MEPKYLYENDFVSLNVSLGGNEAVAPTFGTPFNIKCWLQSWTDANQSETIDQTDRCDTLSQNLGIRANRNVTFTCWIPRASAMAFGSAVNHHIRVTPVYATTPNFTEILTGVIRQNERGSARGQQMEVTISFIVKSVA